MKQLIKCVFIGDGTVGKTCILMVRALGEFPHEYVPTIYDNYVSECIVGGKEVVYSLIDTAGQEGYDSLLLKSIFTADVLILCFALNEKNSYYNVEWKWFKLLQDHRLCTPIILVGCKSDIRSTETNAITYEQGQRMANKIGAVQYLECSAKLNIGIDEVFQRTMEVGIGFRTKQKRQKYKRCAIM